MLKCPKCGEYELKAITPGRYFCDNYWCGYEYQGAEQVPLYFPGYDDGLGYEMRQIHPTGRNSTKYRWFICTPNFPSEQYKVNDPHCHCWPRDQKGEARISLFPVKLKVKWGRIKETDQNEIEELVRQNETYTYEQWKNEWIR